MTDLDLTDLKTIATVETYSLFSLLGMDQMDAKDQASVAMDLQVLIWSEFLMHRLPLLLTQLQLEHVQSLVAAQQSMEVILAEIKKFVPSLMPLWLEFSLDFKLQWVRQYWHDRISELDVSIERTSAAFQSKLRTDLQQARRAAALADAGQWQALIEFLNPKSSSAA